MDKLLEQFLRIGLDERTGRNTIANNKVTANLNAVYSRGILNFLSSLLVVVIYSILLLLSSPRLARFCLRIERGDKWNNHKERMEGDMNVQFNGFFWLFL